MPLFKKAPQPAPAMPQPGADGQEQELTKKQERQLKKLRRNLPTKRSINLATVNVKRINWYVATPLILLILLGAGLLSKFAVLDRYAAIAATQAEVDRLQAEIAEGYQKIDSFGSVSLRYARYSLTGMTGEEMSRVDRVEIFRLIRTMMRPYIQIEQWHVSGNVLSVAIRSDSLQRVNILLREIQADPLVSFCTLQNALEEEPEGGKDHTIHTMTLPSTRALNEVQEENEEAEAAEDPLDMLGPLDNNGELLVSATAVIQLRAPERTGT